MGTIKKWQPRRGPFEYLLNNFKFVVKWLEGNGLRYQMSFCKMISYFDPISRWNIGYCLSRNYQNHSVLVINGFTDLS